MKHNEESSFVGEWGQEVASAGFVQVPHDFLRNIGLLNISANEAVILMLIMGYDKGAYITARTFADSMGVDIKTVRTAFRRLDKKMKYMHRHYAVGGANRFTYGGLHTVIRELAKNRQAGIQYVPRGLGSSSLNLRQDLPTNKEENKKIYKEQGEGYKKFQEAKEKLNQRRKI